jgi:U-box domain
MDAAILTPAYNGLLVYFRVSSFLVHRFMLLVVERHFGAMDLYQEEMLSIAQRLSHSPMLNVFQESVQRLDNEGLVQVGAAAVQGGVSLLGRWFHGGFETIAQDLAFATNWDGRFNPDAETSLATSDVASPTAADNETAGGSSSLFALPDVAKYDETDPVHTKPALPNMPSCPITQEPMRDPVVAADGHTYERSAIVRWLQSSDKSPLTGSVLPHKNLVPNYMLLSSLQEQAAAFGASQSPNYPSIMVETVEEESDLDDETTEVQID